MFGFKSKSTKNAIQSDEVEKPIEKSNKEEEKVTKPLQLILFICIGIILILFSIVSNHILHWPVLIHELSKDLGEALIIGPALSWILDLPSMINYFKKITIESLISKEYINNLPRAQLLQLRKDCTAQIHLKDAKVVEKELIDIDEKVCELLTKPYFERYRQNTNCHKEGDLFVKKNYIEELIINPLNTKATYKDFPKAYLAHDISKPINEVYEILSFTVKIDDGEEVDMKPSVTLKANAVNKTDIHFNTEIVWQDKDGNNLSFDFSKKILIRRTTQVKTPLEDIFFIKRVKMPVKSFMVEYNYHGDDLKLIGTCFGTLSYSNDGGMKIIQENSNISIESFNWLLPGNGIVIVKIPK